MIINPICPLPLLNDFPFIENTFQELDLYSLICRVAEKVNELVQQGNTIEQALSTLFADAIKSGKITADLTAEYDKENKNIILKVRANDNE